MTGAPVPSPRLRRLVRLARVAIPLVLAGAMGSGCWRNPDRSAAAATAPSASRPAPTLAPFAGPTGKPEPGHVELGRLLFFDRRLSGDGTTSCATCHDPDKGFTDGLPRAHGKGGKVLRRNTPSVINIDGRAPMFWDGRAASAEEQALMPVKNPDEMARDLPSLIADLERTPEYLARFRRAFGDARITGERIASALAAFERTLVSAGAPLDRYLAGDHTALSPAAARGVALFTGKARCVRCHSGPQLTDGSFHNIGLPGDDLGRFEIVPIAISRRAFKTPSLRDVALTAPYFHDGSAATLADVVAQYNRGGTIKENLDPDIAPLSLSDEEQHDLVELLKAMTGRVSPVEAPRIPVTVDRPRLRSILDVMHLADKTLREIDPSIGEPTVAGTKQIQHLVGPLIEAFEQVPALHPRTVTPDHMPELRERAGELIVALSNLRSFAERGDTTKMAGAADEVRDRCETCHEVFRWPFHHRPR
jgi:cytochrome c peroxidase